ncbi:MAG: hypothetical protein AB1629_01820 [Candidatus Omnitrophota bacterium]
MFNPNARWDRHLPQDDSSAGDLISVSAVFKNSKVTPRWFIWKGKTYRIKEVTYRWQAKLGEETFCYFAVSDSVNTYQINLSTKFLTWRLIKVCID